MSQDDLEPSLGQLKQYHQSIVTQQRNKSRKAVPAEPKTGPIAIKLAFAGNKHVQINLQADDTLQTLKEKVQALLVAGSADFTVVVPYPRLVVLDPNSNLSRRFSSLNLGTRVALQVQGENLTLKQDVALFERREVAGETEDKDDAANGSKLKDEIKKDVKKVKKGVPKWLKLGKK